jgi:hypothetical protein
MTLIDLSKLPVPELIDLLVDKGIGRSQANALVANLIRESEGSQEVPFEYETDFPATDAACKAQFSRSFLHTDWVDGESPVQAGSTPDEEGFNERLHHLEDDLEALNTDVRRAFTCLGQVRAAAAGRFDEILKMLNVLNHEVAILLGGGIPPVPPAAPGTVTLGAAPNFRGTTKFFDRDVSVWQTEQGLTILPTVSAVGFDPMTDPLIRSSTGLARIIEEVREIRPAFGDGPVPTSVMLERFGERRVGGGPTVGQLLDILPRDAEYPSLEAMVTDASERSAGLIRTTGLAGSAIAGAFSDFGVGIERIADAPAERFQVLPAEVRAQLAAVEVRTVGDLADMSPQMLTERLRQRGVDVSAGEAAAWTAAAGTLVRIR